MNSRLCFILLMGGIILISCGLGNQPQGNGDELTNVSGTIQQLANNPKWFVIVPDFDTSIRYLPSNLPPELRQNGMRVVFSGQIGEIPPNVRLIGTPLDLTFIEKTQ